MFLSFLICLAHGRLNQTGEGALIKDVLKEPITYNLIVGERLKLRTYTLAEYAIDVSLKHEDERNIDICWPVQQKVVFGDYDKMSRVIYEPEYKPSEEHSTDPSYFLSKPIMLNMIHIIQGIVVVTSDHQLLLFQVVEDKFQATGFATISLQNVSFADLRPYATNFETPHLVYSPLTNYLYVIYKDQVIGGHIEQNNITVRNISNQGLENDKNYIGNIQISSTFMFVPLGSEGLDIYEFQFDGSLKLIKSLGSYDLFNKTADLQIVDAAIGGKRQNYLYVLDHNLGVVKFNLSYQDSLQVVRDDDLGVIDVSYGIQIKEHNEEFLLILCDKGVIQYLYEIGLWRNDWFRVKVHHLNGRYFDIDITNEFTILRGVDEHRIIITGIYEEFEPDITYQSSDDVYKEQANSFQEQYVFIPRLQSLEFYNHGFGMGDPLAWHFNLSHPFLLGITNHRLVELPYIIEHPYVACETKSKRGIGRQWNYKLILNSTSCAEKSAVLNAEDFTKKGNLPPQLMMCQIQEQLNINVISGDGVVYDTSELVSIIVGLIVLLVILAFVLAYLYNKYRSRTDSLITDINKLSGAEQNSYEMEPNDQAQGL